eukprot:CAMPEP_0194584528 /NCGR_PEP_ID=MMETSP0292-20121207/17097_1 /TAXON_ID=39354 /ORGANISM="Heterosigma akashiwo, Strain CCMP2393" /LENGTH=99 /DNA_ID=CAMNT_0039439575 /DNA_START=204 /DNA_END=499 /DNA_ORIENTATION=+
MRATRTSRVKRVSREEAMKKAAAIKQALENKYGKMKQDSEDSQQRLEELEREMNALGLSEDEKARRREEFQKNEGSARMERKRRLGCADFEPLAVVGRG